MNKKYYEDFVKETEIFEKIDLYIAVIVYIIIFALYFIWGRTIRLHFDEKTPIIVIYGIGFAIHCAILAVIAVICKMRKQCFTTLLRKRPYDVGVLGAFIIIIIAGSAYILSKGNANHEISEIIMRFMYVLFVIAIPEELIYREYIGRRFYGVISNHAVSVVVVGVMYAIIHSPFEIGLGHNDWVRLFPLFMHILFHYIYAKTNNIHIPIIIHAIWDFVAAS